MKIHLLILFIGLCVSKTQAQELKEDKIDPFTKSSVKRTSWEAMTQTGKSYTFFRVSKLDSLLYLDLKLMLPNRSKFFTIGEGMKLLFILENDSVITLSTLNNKAACRGCGARGFGGSSALGIETSYAVYPELILPLKAGAVKKMRVYTSEGFIDEDIPGKRSRLITDLLLLVE